MCIEDLAIIKACDLTIQRLINVLHKITKKYYCPFRPANMFGNTIKSFDS
jgi:hypothetical protein